MYKSRYRRQTSITDYLIPFFIIICAGLIFVLGFKLWKAFFGETLDQPVYLHVVSGSAQMQTWGDEDFFELSTTSLIMQGDEVVTSSDSQVIVEFFDGTIMRLGSGTDIVFEEFNGEDGTYLKLMLIDGSVWFNKFYKDTGSTEIVVDMGTVVVNSTEKSIFEVENDMDKTVRVLKGGGVMANIYDEAKEAIVESENIGVGQEIVFSAEVLGKYWLHQSPSVLSAISNDFEDTVWYLWNDAEDKAPTQFVKDASGQYIKVEPQVVVTEEGGEEEEVPEETADGTEEEQTPDEVVEPEKVEDEDLVDLGALTVPTINSVAGLTSPNEGGFYVVTGNPATLTGNVSGAKDVVVNGYVLQKFNAGDKTWTYYANADFGYMHEGENTYEIYAIAPDGTESEKIFVKVMYSPPAPAPDPDPDPVMPAEPAVDSTFGDEEVTDEI